MTDENKTNPIEVPVTELPSRREIKHIKKTGETLDGHKVHPLDMQRLRTAKMVDLFKFGEEVNKANSELKNYVDKTQMQRDWTFINLIGFLIEKDILNKDEFEAYSQKAAEEMKRATEAAIKAKEEKEGDTTS